MSEAQAAQPPEIPGFSYVQRLGSGGYSDVYLYEKQHPKMKVAVKVLTGEDLTESDRRQFMAEANAMAELADHPSIVQVFNADVTSDGRPYLVMKYYPDENMSVRASREHFSVADVLRIGIQISDAVETAHRAGILHRDIKPANILTGQYGATGLTDFGIAVTKGAETTDGSAGMSIPWAPPEVIFATSEADERSDVYSLGATVWHLLVGRSPFVAPGGDNSQWALMRRIQESAPPRTGRADVPDSLERLLQQAMSKDPSLRPQSALAFARAMQAVEQEQRWPVTPTLVDRPDREPVAPRDAAVHEAATRQRPLQQVRAQPAPDTARRPAPHVGADDQTREGSRRIAGADADAPSSADAVHGRREARARVFGAAAPALEGTVRRETPTDPADDGGSATERRGHGKAVLIAAAAVIAVGAAVGGIVLVGPSKSADPSSQTTTSPRSGDDNLDVLRELPPGVPVVTVGRASADTVQFQWTYANPEAGDSFRWRSANGSGASSQSPQATAGVVSTPLLSMRAVAGHAQCVVVEVVRADGSASSNWSDPACSS